VLPSERRDAGAAPSAAVPVAGGLVPAPAGGDADLQTNELRALLTAVAGRAELAAHVERLRPAGGERSWECLHRDEHTDVYVIAWTAGADTGWHDHDASSGALHVLEGTVTEERLRWADDHERLHLSAGEALSFGPDHVHRMTVSDGRAVTLHAYSPPLRRMGQYSFDGGGALQRRTITYRESLGAGLAY
jgi:quercetin dioxygenase-like cupin family protein